jgi:hypothetical protein
MKMKIILLAFTIIATTLCKAQTTAKPDTIRGVAIYTAPYNIGNMSNGVYHTLTVAATEIKTDTGIISIRTELGYLDLKKDYRFIPINKLQPSKLKSKP